MQSHPLANTEVLWLFKHPAESVSYTNTWLGAFVVTTKINEDRLCSKRTADNSNRTRLNLHPSDFLPAAAPLIIQSPLRDDHSMTSGDILRILIKRRRKNCICSGNYFTKRTWVIWRGTLDCVHLTEISRLNYIILELYGTERLRVRPPDRHTERRAMIRQ